MGAVDVLHIGESHLHSAPTALTHNELSVADAPFVDIATEVVEQLFVSYDFAKFHLL
jgi:hypothetical protein